MALWLLGKIETFPREFGHSSLKGHVFIKQEQVF